MSAPILQITTRQAVDPASIAIDGTVYPLRSLRDLGWAQTIRYTALHRQLMAARAGVVSAQATVDDEAAMEAVVDELMLLAVDAPAEVLQLLRCDHKLAVIAAAFFDYRPPARQATGGATMEA
jgi:hypothetical protein